MDSSAQPAACRNALMIVSARNAGSRSAPPIAPGSGLAFFTACAKRASATSSFGSAPRFYFRRDVDERPGHLSRPSPSKFPSADCRA